VKLLEKKALQSLSFFCIFIVILLFFIGDKGLLQLRELKQKEVSLHSEIEVLKQEKREWINRVDLLKKDQTYFETLAREKLGMIRSDEILIEIVHDEKTE